MFCDLVDSTKLSSQLDPEDYREVVREYQRVCTDVIRRYDGYIAQLLGDGLLVYFGYSVAHEDDA
jgi:class 3 adenylate cyclase